MTTDRVRGADLPSADAMPSLTRRRVRSALTTLVVPALLVLGVPLLFTSYRLTSLTTVATYLIVAVGFNIVFGYAGTIFVGHAAFALLGAYTVALTQHHLAWPLWAGALAAMVVCGLVAGVAALPALRMVPFAVAVTTLLYLPALNSAIQYFSSFTLGGDGVPATRAALDGSGRWYLTAVVAAIVWLAARNLLVSPIGRAWNITNVAPELAESLGIDTTRAKLAAVVIASALAGLGGAFWPILNGFTSPDTYDLNFMILILVMVIVGGQGTVNGPVVGAILIGAISLVVTEVFTEGGRASDILYAVLVLGVILLAPGGVVGIITGLWRRTPWSRSGTAASVPRRDHEVAELMPEVQDVTLEVHGVSWTVGGLQVLRDVSMTVQGGSVHGLIGPNGAGKTSLLNCISGHLQATGGHATINGRRLEGIPSQRTRLGLSRTFQHPALLQHHTVLENVLVGVDSHRRVTTLQYLLRLPASRREQEQSEVEALAWLEVVGLAHLAQEEAATLGPGQQRQLEMARALATRPGVLLLDEPAAGLNATEVQIIEEVIREVARRGIAVILIEHHFELVRRLCDEVTVLDSGRIIFRGRPEDGANDPRVVEAYLGTQQEPPREDETSDVAGRAEQH